MPIDVRRVHDVHDADETVKEDVHHLDKDDLCLLKVLGVCHDLVRHPCAAPLLVRHKEAVRFDRLQCLQQLRRKRRREDDLELVADEFDVGHCHEEGISPPRLCLHPPCIDVCLWRVLELLDACGVRVRVMTAAVFGDAM